MAKIYEQPFQKDPPQIELNCWKKVQPSADIGYSLNTLSVRQPIKLLSIVHEEILCFPGLICKGGHNGYKFCSTKYSHLFRMLRGSSGKTILYETRYFYLQLPLDNNKVFTFS